MTYLTFWAVSQGLPLWSKSWQVVKTQHIYRLFYLYTAMSKSVFRPELVYKHIAYCIRSECPLSKVCLRHLAYQHAPSFLEAPFVDPRKPMGEACPYYLDSQPLRFVRGFRRGKYRLRYGDVASFNKRASSLLGCQRTLYYRYASGLTRLAPEQQEQIQRLFADFGVTGDPLFDSYEDGYLLD